MKIFLACHQVHAKMAPNGDRRYYRKWSDGRGGSEGKSDDAPFHVTRTHTLEILSIDNQMRHICMRAFYY